eukprot:SAG31_NODE_6117_length_2162_cov_1.509937_2_plen_82_part_00
MKKKKKKKKKKELMFEGRRVHFWRYPKEPHSKGLLNMKELKSIMEVPTLATVIWKNKLHVLPGCTTWIRLYTAVNVNVYNL